MEGYGGLFSFVFIESKPLVQQLGLCTLYFAAYRSSIV